MIYLLFSDIHSNLEALTAFLKEKENIKHDKMVCLGDVVGYNANPNECVEILKKLQDKEDVRFIKGNHDFVVCSEKIPETYNPIAGKALVWQMQAITDENKLWLNEEMKDQIIDDTTVFMHGALSYKFDYIVNNSHAVVEFNLMVDTYADILVVGHTHRPIVFELSGEDVKIEGLFEKKYAVSTYFKEHKYKKGSKIILNDGSIGQPRDDNPKGSFAVLDTDKRTIEIKRFDYDIEATQKKIIDAGLPDILAQRLESGW